MPGLESLDPAERKLMRQERGKKTRIRKMVEEFWREKV